MSVHAWRTKAAACLLRETGASTVEEGVCRIVADVKKTAFEQGYKAGTLKPPYDPKPLALILGAREVRAAALGFDGHVARDGDGLVVEYDSETRSRTRRRFTVAHEVGHLVLWNVTKDVRKLPARRSPKGSELEELCNKIGAEILAPRHEVKALWNCADAYSATQSKADFILRLAETFDISVNSAAIRFREVCSPRLGIALINLSERRYEWCHGVPSKYRLLQGLLEKLKNAQHFGADCFSIDTAYGVRMLTYQWHKIAEGLFLILLSR